MVNGAEPKPPNPAVKPEEILNESTDLIANYIVGNLVISVTAGLISFAGFQIIGVRLALILAAWVAFTDLIPVVGAFILLSTDGPQDSSGNPLTSCEVLPLSATTEPRWSHVPDAPSLAAV